MFFRDWVRRVLKEKCGMRGLEGKWWDWVWAFGLSRGKGKSDGVNKDLVNFFLCVARHVTYLARNYSLYEEKMVNRKILCQTFFQCFMRGLHYKNVREFRGKWCATNTLCRVGSDGVLVFDWLI